MSDEGSSPVPETPPREFRWSAIFRRSAEPVFFLNRHRRLLFVNPAWERLTGLGNAEVRGLSCKRSNPVDPSNPWEEVLAHALCPPRDVLQGRPGHARRLIPRAGGAHWWDVEFFPLCDEHGVLGYLGKIIPVAAEGTAEQQPLPERVVALRESLARRYSLDGLASRVPVMQRAAEQARLAGQIRVPVLIRGEAGAGKQWLARTIHYQSAPARSANFVLLDCRRLPAAFLEKTLFDEGGLVLQAAAGTLYIKEPALLPRDVQARLCLLLADARPETPRVLAGCSSDPAVDVRAGRLLEELYCALTALVIEVPPLRQRAADLSWLVERFLARAGEEGGKTVKGLTPDAWAVVRGHSWPGNLRELYRVLAAAREHTPGEWIDAADLPMYLRLGGPPAEPPAAPSLPLDWLLQEAERRLIQLALRKTGGNKAKTAEMLAIWKPRLLRRMKALGLTDPDEGKTPETDTPESDDT
jgi:PAS domain S-box-containing protein